MGIDPEKSETLPQKEETMCSSNLAVLKCVNKQLKIWLLVVAFVSLSVKTSFSSIIDEKMPGSIPKEIVDDWKAQGGTAEQIKASLPAEYAEKCDGSFESACHWRRVYRMKPYAEDIQKIIFAKHHNMGGPLVGFTEGLWPMSVATEWENQSALCLLEFKDYYSKHSYILEDPSGVLKDPCVSFDGKKLLFAWCKGSGSSRGGFAMPEGFKLFELELDDPSKQRQITHNPSGLKVSDYEPCYLQNGDIMFNSSRCFGMVDCAYNQTSNLYMCHESGKYLRRVCYDQVHTFYPVLMDNGKVMYTRWEYNDRTLMNAMGLFTMNPDGTNQTEYFGNQLTWPMTIIHGRQIPGSSKIMAVISGHHATYNGELVVIDPYLGRNSSSSVQLVAPKREPKNTFFLGTDGGVEFTFQNPWPLDEENFLISWRPSSSTKLFKLYFMNVDGERELIAWDDQSVSQPVLLKEREKPPMPRVGADWTKKTGVFTVEDVHYGTGMVQSGGKQVPQGTVKKIRVVALDYRINHQVGYTGSDYDGYQMTPVSRWTGSWEAKRVLGEAPVYEDGSASFEVPALEPVYFQLLDENGYCVQTMRSWSTLMPGETFSCYGCHEDKNESFPPKGQSIAGQTGPKPLTPFNGIENEGFNYRKFVQPIWDEHCIECHDGTQKPDLRGDLIWCEDLNQNKHALNRPSKKYWTRSYISLTEDEGAYVKWINLYDPAPPKRAYFSESSNNSKLMQKIEGGHKGATLSQSEKEIIACWIDLCIPHAGYYTDFMKSSDSTAFMKALENRINHEKIEKTNIEEFVADGQYLQDLYNPTSISYFNSDDIKSINTNKHISNIKFLANERILFVTATGDIEFTLLDLCGSQLNKSNIFAENTNAKRSMYIPLPSSLSRGIYIAKISDNHSTRERLISVVR